MRIAPMLKCCANFSPWCLQVVRYAFNARGGFLECGHDPGYHRGIPLFRARHVWVEFSGQVGLIDRCMLIFNIGKG
jgi:hypothetical protein